MVKVIYMVELTIEQMKTIWRRAEKACREMNPTDEFVLVCTPALVNLQAQVMLK